MYIDYINKLIIKLNKKRVLFTYPNVVKATKLEVVEYFLNVSQKTYLP